MAEICQNGYTDALRFLQENRKYLFVWVHFYLKPVKHIKTETKKSRKLLNNDHCLKL